jgi:hypothetical protein
VFGAPCALWNILVCIAIAKAWLQTKRKIEKNHLPCKRFAEFLKTIFTVTERGNGASHPLLEMPYAVRNLHTIELVLVADLFCSSDGVGKMSPQRIDRVSLHSTFLFIERESCRRSKFETYDSLRGEGCEISQSMALHGKDWNDTRKGIRLDTSTIRLLEVCFQNVLLQHSLRIEERTIQGDCMPHDFDEAMSVVVESGNDRVF